MPNIYGYGQVFAFSALDGESKYKNDFTGTLTAKPFGIRFEVSTPRTLFCDCAITKVITVTGDIINVETAEGEILIVYKDRHCVVGYSPVLPALKGGLSIRPNKNITVSFSINNIVVLAVLISRLSRVVLRPAVFPNTYRDLDTPTPYFGTLNKSFMLLVVTRSA